MIIILFHNANITDINSIVEKGLLSANVTNNHNWKENKRADNSEDVVYLFNPKGDINTFVEYGICLIEVDVDNAKENELISNDHHLKDYTEYIIESVSPHQIKAIYIPQIFKSRIKKYIELSDKALEKIVWCDMYAEKYIRYIPNPNDKYGLGGTDIYETTDIGTLEKFAKTTTLDVTGYNYFRGVDDNNKMIDLYNIKYTKGD